MHQQQSLFLSNSKKRHTITPTKRKLRTWNFPNTYIEIPRNILDTLWYPLIPSDTLFTWVDIAIISYYINPAHIICVLSVYHYYNFLQSATTNVNNNLKHIIIIRKPFKSVRVAYYYTATVFRSWKTAYMPKHIIIIIVIIF